MKTKSKVVPVGYPEFEEYVVKNMPPNTVISDPKWWAQRLWRAAHSAPSVTSEPVAWGIEVTWSAFPERSQFEYIDNDRDAINAHLNDLLLQDEDKLIISARLVPLYTHPPADRDAVLEALRFLVELKQVKRMIEAGTADAEAKNFYEKNKESGWIAAEAALKSTADKESGK